MTLQDELARLFRRDLRRLRRQILAFPSDDALWRVPPGITNPAGALALHIEGNLREYVGRQVGGTPYVRDRAAEFSGRGVPVAEVAARVDALLELVPSVISSLSAERLEAEHPELVLDMPTSVRELLLHLYAHLSWHLGQIDSARRVVTGHGAIPAVGLAD